jgi:chloramphenicol O-acetyltransferase
MAKIVDMHFELDLQVTSTVIYVLHEVTVSLTCFSRQKKSINYCWSAGGVL